jgi:hypothetical protein
MAQHPPLPFPLILRSASLFALLHGLGFLVVGLRTRDRGRATLHAHFACMLVASSTLAWLGFRAWFFAPTRGSSQPSIDRLGGYDRSGETIAAIFATTSCYNALVASQCKPLQGKTLVCTLGLPQFLFHHLLACLISCCALAARTGLHFASFFFGAVELSSVPFALIELMRALPKLRSKHAAAFDLATQSFALAFIPLRLLYWPSVTARLLSDSTREVLNGPDASWGRPPCSTPLVCATLLATALLSALQVWWGGRLLFFWRNPGLREYYDG